MAVLARLAKVALLRSLQRSRALCLSRCFQRRQIHSPVFIEWRLPMSLRGDRTCPQSLPVRFGSCHRRLEEWHCFGVLREAAPLLHSFVDCLVGRHRQAGFGEFVVACPETFGTVCPSAISRDGDKSKSCLTGAVFLGSRRWHANNSTPSAGENDLLRTQPWK